MNRYYAQSSFFSWLRRRLKIHKPHALPAGGWEKWQNELKSDRPVAYWLTETLPDWLEKPAEWFLDPMADIKYYIRNRWITQTHCLKTGLKPGQYHELSDRMLHGLFTELVDFVEVEKAHMQVGWGNNQDKKQYGLPWWRRVHWFRWSQWRSAEAGLDYLNWEQTLTYQAEELGADDSMIGQPTPQAVAAQEILALYHWWKQVRPVRPDPMDASGWTDYCDQLGSSGSLLAALDDRSEPDREHSRQMLTVMQDLEQQQAQEDQDMLIRLIKIRTALWT